MLLCIFCDEERKRRSFENVTLVLNIKVITGFDMIAKWTMCKHISWDIIIAS